MHDFPTVAFRSDSMTAMPVALQIAGRPGNDVALLESGRRMQAATRWRSHVPTGILDLIEIA
jgi:Asp-tRNA(Asn)/Glu-tRNA(Gln) amidotransferase A subunit family amidase